MTADLDAITAALTESCVALRLVQTDYCLDFDAEDLRALVAELRVAREVVEAATLIWSAKDCLNFPSNRQYNCYQPPPEGWVVDVLLLCLSCALDAYRAVVGEA